ncbi:DUF4334 domain-containing protein [Roseofilum capinflatum]|uniref:DUF4334 domain-containing protein n=1 Tax=Roseofilum capinflatum BLCC-M114 TaxID=3022440 RepID=A0ABT7BCJ1_9CYAN|nr:DUF4334 domain-containing protein [Roseofilum capinflatum]MDJ1176882.1 DUF4334 domain-containing protein [Roseofilum capinflatum BLCC-M114]
MTVNQNRDILKRSPSILQNGQTTLETALDLFDALEPVTLEFMLGRWRGSGLHTDHPMDGLLEASNWYGKEFINAETVHPLLFLDGQGQLIKVAPYARAMEWVGKIPKTNLGMIRPLFNLTSALLKTEKSQARLRMMEYRNKVSATMIYDYLPINDSFRKIDDRTVLGVMDFKSLPQPFFFVLQRSMLK